MLTLSLSPLYLYLPRMDPCVLSLITQTQDYCNFNIIRCTCPSIHYLSMYPVYNSVHSNSTLSYPIRASIYSLFICFFLIRLCLRVFGLTTFQALHAIWKVLHGLLTCKDSTMSKVCAVSCRCLETVRGLFCD